MGDMDLIKELNNYIYENNLTAFRVAGMLNVRPETISHWRRGRAISPAKREAITALLEPGNRSDDGIISETVKTLKDLDRKDRIAVLAFAEELKNINKKTCKPRKSK